MKTNVFASKDLIDGWSLDTAVPAPGEGGEGVCGLASQSGERTTLNSHERSPFVLPVAVRTMEAVSVMK